MCTLRRTVAPRNPRPGTVRDTAHPVVLVTHFSVLPGSAPRHPPGYDSESQAVTTHLHPRQTPRREERLPGVAAENRSILEIITTASDLLLRR